jgi:sugar phosphate permease
MCLNGFFQAAVWPGIIGIFGNWFKNDKNGTLLALLVMGGNLGNIYASNICNIL